MRNCELERSALTVATANAMTRFADELSDSYHRMMAGKPMSVAPSYLVTKALDVKGGIICPLLIAYGEGDPCPSDLPFIEKLCLSIESVFEIGENVARQLKLYARAGLQYVHRFSISPRKLFSIGYLARCASKYANKQAALMRITERLCGAYRRFLTWLRIGLRQLEARQTTDGDPLFPIKLAGYARGVVEIANPRQGLVVLKATSREGSQPFHILPTSHKAWAIIRALCEDGDCEGFVTLPNNYAANFHRTDKDNNSINDDYARLLRHIVPGVIAGRYRLELEEKPLRCR